MYHFPMVLGPPAFIEKNTPWVSGHMHTVSSPVLLVTIENQMRNSRKDKGPLRKHSVPPWKKHELFLGDGSLKFPEAQLQNS